MVMRFGGIGHWPRVKRINIEHWNPIAVDIRANAGPQYDHNFQIFRDFYDETKAIMKRL